MWICVGAYWHSTSFTLTFHAMNYIRVAPCVTSLNLNFTIPTDSVLLCSLFGCIFSVVHLTDVSQ